VPLSELFLEGLQIFQRRPESQDGGGAHMRRKSNRSFTTETQSHREKLEQEKPKQFQLRVAPDHTEAWRDGFFHQDFLCDSVPLW
jgi:hypothetical protein